MNIFDFYKDPAKHNELGEILTLCTKRPDSDTTTSLVSVRIELNVKNSSSKPGASRYGHNNTPLRAN